MLVFLLCDFAFKEIYYHSKPLQELKNLHISLSKQVSGFKKKKKSKCFQYHIMNLTVILCSIKILLWLVNSLCLHDHKLSSRLMFGYIEFDLMTVAHKSECWLQHPRITEITQLNFSIFKLSISVCVCVQACVWPCYQKHTNTCLL